MSTVSHTHIAEGDANTVGAPNATMASWEAATADLNEDNVRPEGIYRRNILFPRHNTTGTQLYEDSGAAQTITTGAGWTDVSLASGAATINYTPVSATMVGVGRVRCSFRFVATAPGGAASETNSAEFRLMVQNDGGGYNAVAGGGRQWTLGLHGSTAYDAFDHNGDCTIVVSALAVAGTQVDYKLQARSVSSGATTPDMTVSHVVLSVQLGLE